MMDKQPGARMRDSSPRLERSVRENFLVETASKKYTKGSVHWEYFYQLSVQIDGQLIRVVYYVKIIDARNT